MSKNITNIEASTEKSVEYLFKLYLWIERKVGYKGESSQMETLRKRADFWIKLLSSVGLETFLRLCKEFEDEDKRFINLPPPNKCKNIIYTITAFYQCHVLRRYPNPSQYFSKVLKLPPKEVNIMKKTYTVYITNLMKLQQSWIKHVDDFEKECKNE